MAPDGVPQQDPLARLRQGAAGGAASWILTYRTICRTVAEMCPTIRFRVDELPPIKRGSESMWRKQVGRVKSLRAAAAEQPHEPATLDDDVHLDVVVYARPLDGDLDGFIAGICDGLQPAHPNYHPWLQAADWEDLPMSARPDHALGFADDRAISTISARRVAPTGRLGYDVSITW